VPRGYKPIISSSPPPRHDKLTGMNKTPREVSAGTAFWRFSLAFYALPGVAKALIALQDDLGFDINLILFGLWLGFSGRGRLDGARLAAAEAASQPLRTEIVMPLRRMRRRIAPHPETDFRSLRTAMLKLELRAERAAQERLAGGAGPSDRPADLPARRTDAQANLSFYLGADAAGRSEAAVVSRAFAAFSATDPARALTSSRRSAARARPIA
jgi:uncharacterized protein (TIGR02444 family)